MNMKQRLQYRLNESSSRVQERTFDQPGRTARKRYDYSNSWVKSGTRINLKSTDEL